MSAIAAFYLVPEASIGEVVTAATPVRGGLFRPARDTFWDVLSTRASELAPFTDGSGWVFNTLDLYLQERHELAYDSFGDVDLSKAISQPRRSYWLALRPAAAERLVAALDALTVDDADLVAFIRSERGTDDVSEEGKATRLALETFKRWLREVSPGAIGLLSVG